MERVQKQNNESDNSRHMTQAKFTTKSLENELASTVDNSPTVVAQHKRLQSLFGEAIQRQGLEEEPLQRKFGATQRIEDEEPLQGKFNAMQRVEEEEALQGKFRASQRVEEEEPLQGRFKTVQRIEEEPLQGKFNTVQRIEEEEPLQGKFEVAQRAEEEEPLQGKFEHVPHENKPNNTGMPDRLKSGVESLSGISMDNVKVHYNSSHPAQLNAHAYAQGTDIHVAPGQEQHLPHEAWHVVQQAQGRVQPTMQMKGGVPINNDTGLEHEADVMGARAASSEKSTTSDFTPAQSDAMSTVLQGEFFEKTEAGNYIWHDEDPDHTWHLLPETRAYHSWYNPLRAIYGSYPVYTQGAVDRSGQLVSGGLSPLETAAMLNIWAVIAGTAYANILQYLENRILNHLSQGVLDEFYRGAHIIFDDDGQVYRDVFALGQTVGKFRDQTWSEWFSDTPVAQTPDNLLPSTTRGPGMGSRRPEKSQTSHYSQDALPQLGIDLPGQLSGHILVGMVPNDPYRYGDSAGHSFVQTEMFGFKTFTDHYWGHAKGYFWNVTGSHQSGLVGFCKYSEKSQTEIREQDNPHI
jgi:hypothetical protein